MEIGGTKVIVGVYGPHPIASTRLTQHYQHHRIEEAFINCHLNYTSFATPTLGRQPQRSNRRSFTREKEEKEYSMLMVQALEVSVRLNKYPKSQIDIHALVLQSDGGALSAAITAGSLALADAGIEILDLVAACSAGQALGQIVLDPDYLEENSKTGNLTVALMPSLNEVTQIFQTGDIQHLKSLEALHLCLDGCGKIYSMMTKNLIETSSKKLASTSTPTPTQQSFGPFGDKKRKQLET